MKLYREVNTCRACGSDNLRAVLDFGDVAISDFPRPGDDLDYAPLTLVYCERCELVQLRHSVDRDRLYSHYYYTSGLNESMVKALADVVRDASEWVALEPGDRVLDIGANDGTLLDQYPDWLKRCGFEPSNVAPVDPALYIWRTYFPSRDLRPPKGDCKIITACACFYDLDEPGAFLDEVTRWLHPDGVFVIQMPDLGQMLGLNAFDNVCHEHTCYWPTYTLQRFAAAHGLQLIDLSENDVNGGSIRYTFAHGPRVEMGEDCSVYAQDLAAFAERVRRLRIETRGLLYALKESGASIWAYGASTKGNTTLQYYGLGPDVLTAVADRNPEKWGREMVTGIPICSEDAFRRARPDYALILPWGFLDNFVKREADYLDSGGQFISPLPDLKVIGGPNASLHASPTPSVARAGVS